MAEVGQARQQVHAGDLIACVISRPAEYHKRDEVGCGSKAATAYVFT
jgi:hypothetical protein